ncbi:MAG: PilZ domain-containing protein [Nitrospirae bacterium]|nr:PilZ domain-containing protein [Nitrospirota bacterium]
MGFSGREKRKLKRIGYDMPLEFSMNVLEFGNARTVNYTGRTIDISEEGIGFLTEGKLEPGNFIRIEQRDGSCQTAEIRWVGELEGELRVGVLFYKD